MITKEFLTAGRAVFTVSNGKGDSYTYRIKKFRDGRLCDKFKIYFLQPGYLLQERPTNTIYLGVLNPDTGSIIPSFLVGVYGLPLLVLQWALETIWKGYSFPEGYTAENMGFCGRCGRRLTTPESQSRGLGRLCAGRVG